MKRMTKTLAAAAIVAAAGSSALAYASTHSTRNDANAIEHASISLSQAIKAAEQHVDGKATHARYDGSGHDGVYDVEVKGKRKVYDVTVNAQDGKVLTASADHIDHENDHEDHEDND